MNPKGKKASWTYESLDAANPLKLLGDPHTRRNRQCDGQIDRPEIDVDTPC